MYFTELCGRKSSGGPLCHLLRADGYTVLIGCGWDESFTTEILDPVVRELKFVDAVLLCHANLDHLGALPYLVGRCGLQATIYSTLPVRRMGQLVLSEYCHAKQAEGEFGVFDHSDVDKAFKEHPWVQLRYLQQYKVSEGKMAGLTLTPYNAGHSVGGSVWKISLKDGSTIIYAVDWCHKRERHLNGASITDLSSRPSLLIAGAAGVRAQMVSSLRRDTELLEVVMATLRGDGCVLIPVDAVGRMLEVAMLLEEFWIQERMVYPLVLLSHTSSQVFEEAQHQLEWMSDRMGAAFGAKRDNPFLMRFLKQMSSMEQLAQLPAGPKVVLAFCASLEFGFSRQLLFEWAADAKNTICFIDRAPEGTVAETLQTHASSNEPLVLSLQQTQRVQLEGPELEQHMRLLGQAVELEDATGELLGEDHGMDSGSARPPGPLHSHMSVDFPGASPHGSCTPLPGAFCPVTAHVDGFQLSEGQHQAIFPDEDEDMAKACDDYGMVLGFPGAGAGSTASDPRRQPVADPEGTAYLPHSRDAPPGEQAPAPEPEVPTKLVSQTRQVSVAAAVRFFDFSGIADGPILRQTIQEVAPQHLVLVRGSPLERAELAKHSELALSDFHCRISAADPGRPVHISLARSCTLFLSDQANEAIRLHPMQHYALAQLEATVERPDVHHPTMMQLVPAELDSRGEDVFIVDSFNGVQLSQVKKALADAGIESIFQGGRLLCGPVTISKGRHDKAHLVLQGALLEDFFKVRQVIYGLFNVCS